MASQLWFPSLPSFSPDGLLGSGVDMSVSYREKLGAELFLDLCFEEPVAGK